MSWWSWQSAGKRQWKAVGAPVVAPVGYAPYNSYPFLRLGSKGDLVAWAQQLLAGGGYSTPITGYFQAPTQGAVYSFQAAKACPDREHRRPPGTCCSRTRRCPCAGPAAGRSPPPGPNALPPPRSATLPAKRCEIPPPRERAASARRPRRP